MASQKRKQRAFTKGRICFRKDLYVSNGPHMFETPPISCLFWMIFFPLCWESPYVANHAPICGPYASFCLIFRSLNMTSSHRMFSMGYRRAKATQGNTNFQKRILLANNFWITTRGPKIDKVSTSEQQLISRPLQLLLNTICKLLFSQLLERLWKTLQPHLQRTDKNYRNSNTWKTTLWRKMTRLKKSYLYFLWKLR